MSCTLEEKMKRKKEREDRAEKMLNSGKLNKAEEAFAKNFAKKDRSVPVGFVASDKKE